MGERWTYDKQERNDNGYGDIYIGDSRAYRHDDYVRIHNADCDAYEARIAELEELARRVKAESLRVVEVGEREHPGSIGDSFQLLTIEGYLGIQYSDEDLILLAGPEEEMLGFCDIHPETQVQKVRLERWETENGN